jgi:hypothetical protein
MLVLQGACVPERSPGIRACQADGKHPREAASSGRLAVLPSAAEGVEVDSGAWFTLAHPVEFGAASFLVLSSRLVASRPVDIEELGLIYRADGHPAPPPIVDLSFARPVYGVPMEQWKPDAPDAARALASGGAARTERVEHLEIGLATSRWLPFPGCPASVQVVRRRDLALHVGSGARWAALSGEGLRVRARQAGVSAVGVVWDTVFDPQSWQGPIAGVVANVSDDTARGRVVRLVLSPQPRRPVHAGPRAASPIGSYDTLTYPLPAMPPGSVAAFAGGALGYRQRIVSRSVLTLRGGRRPKRSHGP